jgi:hypothetical protein
MDPGYQGRYSGVLAIFGDCENRFVGRDNVEVIDNA